MDRTTGVERFAPFSLTQNFQNHPHGVVAMDDIKRQIRVAPEPIGSLRTKRMTVASNCTNVELKSVFYFVLACVFIII